MLEHKRKCSVEGDFRKFEEGTRQKNVKNCFVWFEVPTPVSTKMAVFWVECRVVW
jgi:hypothetical protein